MAALNTIASVGLMGVIIWMAVDRNVGASKRVVVHSVVCTQIKLEALVDEIGGFVHL